VTDSPDPRRAAPDLARLPIAFDLGAVSLAEGLRAGLSVAVIVAASTWLHWPGMIEAALAALFTCLSDSGGPVKRRVLAMSSMSVAGALVVVAGGLTRSLGPLVALPFGALAIFLCTYARVYGQAAQQVGMMLCFVVVLSLDHAQPSLLHGAQLGGMFLAGGSWASLLTLVIWRVHPIRPVRNAVASVYRALALMTRDLRSIVRTGATSGGDWDAYTRVHRRAVRDAIEAARGLALDATRRQGSATSRAVQSFIRLEAADQLFGALVGLSELLEASDDAARKMAARILRRLEPLLTSLAEFVRGDPAAPDDRIERAIGAIGADVRRLPSDSPLRPAGEVIFTRLQAASSVDTPNPPAFAGQHGDLRQASASLWEPVRDNLNWRSLTFRHALRAAVTAAPAIAFTLIWFTPYDHWLTIAIIATMQPYFGNTFARALERAAGTLAGGLLAALMGMFVTTRLEIAAAMFPLAVVALAIRSASFGLYMAALTPMIVVLVELGQPGASGWQIAAARALLTLIGCLIAVASSYLLWPSWEPDRLPAEVRAAIEAHGRYAAAVFSLRLGETRVRDVEDARRSVGLATNNAETSISRALLEPTRAHARLEAALLVVAALRRLGGRLVAVQLDPALGGASDPGLLVRWRDWIVRSLHEVASGATRLTAPPSEAGDASPDTLNRIARQIHLIAAAMDRVEAS
jgi:uncharacterized membrane protein YccC